ncbi:CLUMA_CG005121, isoform A [Clunio marinus]|uniref:CLUMA_CG005121, isoform A n=1 Tax=Clunio marinus TaxID=568069 RepID=A0A1J1HVR1_9DIPT|nr:CLUMA_CG005121, isoform A [Clunio marinus]
MEGKTVIVTGSNSGIGKETVRDLAKRGCRIIMACRNLLSANQYRDEIANQTGNQNIVVMKLDLSSLQSVREFSRSFLEKESRLDVLIHNAGYANTFTKTVSVDGIELTMATNHYGPFLLTHLLIDILKKSAPSRIIVVASSWYRVWSPDIENLNPIDNNPWLLYYASKGCNIMFTMELAKRLQGTNVTANCLHPGVIDTGIWRNTHTLLKPGLFIWSKLMKNPVIGAQTTIYLATSEEVKDVSGKYFKDCKEDEPRPYITNPEKCLTLWEESIKIVKLQPTDPKI